MVLSLWYLNKKNAESIITSWFHLPDQRCGRVAKAVYRNALAALEMQ